MRLRFGNIIWKYNLEFETVVQGITIIIQTSLVYRRLVARFVNIPCLPKVHDKWFNVKYLKQQPQHKGIRVQRHYFYTKHDCDKPVFPSAEYTDLKARKSSFRVSCKI